jgi:hypothetical protein
MADFPGFRAVQTPKKEDTGASYGAVNPVTLMPVRTRTDVSSETTTDDSDLFPGLRLIRPAGPSGKEQVNALIQGAASGVAESLPLVGGVAGGVIGFGMAGPPGSAAGIVGGYNAGQLLRDIAAIPSVEELPPDLRPMGYVGEVMGASSLPAAAPFAIAQSGFKFAGTGVNNYSNKIIESARRNPYTVAGAEAMSTGGAAIAEGTAEALSPGNTGLRLSTGLVASMTSGALLFKAASYAQDVWTRTAQTFSEGARTATAAREWQRVIREYGEDPTALAAELRKLDITATGGNRRTSGQLTGSPALQAMEAYLGRQSAQFGGEARQTAQDSLTILRTLTQGLTEIGDPQALAEAARSRESYFNVLISGTVQAAQRDAVEAAANISTDNPADVARLSVRVTELAENALEQGRRVETELWSAIPNMPAGVSNILAEAADLRATRMLKEESFPGVADAFIKRVGAEPKEGEEAVGITLRELTLFRSRMLALAREASARGDASDASIMGSLAEAALDDMAALGVPEIDEARAWSRQLHQVFTETFVGETQATTARGGRRMPPEVVMRRALGTGQEMAAVRASALTRAIEFGSPEAADELFALQERVLRQIAQRVVDPTTGLVNARQLAPYRRNNAALLEQFPEFSEQLENVSTANKFFETVNKRSEAATQAIHDMAAFSGVARAENPVQAVSEILRGQFPQREIAQLARLSYREGPAAVRGLEAALYQDAFFRAGGDSTAFTFDKFRASLFQPIRAGQQSTMQMMQRYGLIDPDIATNMEKILEAAANTQRSINNSQVPLETMLGQENALLNTFLRMGGAGLGSKTAGMAGMQGGLIPAHAGSVLARKLFEKIPAGKVQQVMIEAAKNPQMLAVLLETPTTERQMIESVQRLNAYMLQTGIIRIPEEARQHYAAQEQQQ